jgi:hypothetical protein
VRNEDGTIQRIYRRETLRQVSKAQACEVLEAHLCEVKKQAASPRESRRSMPALGYRHPVGKDVQRESAIYEFSTPEDKQVLVDAFKKGQNQGLVNALTKMPAVGRIAITGILGYDLSYIRLILPWSLSCCRRV